MDKLKALIEIVNRRGVAKVDLFDVSEEKARQSALYKLYSAVATNKFKTEDELADFLYSTDASSKRYLMLKSRLKEKLLNNLFFMDYSDMKLTEHNLENLRSYKTFYSAKILLNNGLRQLGTQYLIRTLKKAQRYHFTEIGLSCALNLRYHFSLIADSAKAAYYDRLVQLFSRQYAIENDSARMYEMLIAGYAKRNYDKHVLVEAEKYVKDIDKQPIKDITFNTRMHIFRIKNIYYVINNQYDECIVACISLENYIKKNKDFYANSRMAEIGQNLLSVYVDTNAVTDARLAVKKYIQYIEEYNYNWYLFLNKYLHLCMLTGNYKEAAEMYQQLTESPRFQYQPEQYREKFKIYRAFMYYVDEQLIQLPKFNTRRYLNDMPEHSKDKLGYNIAILISQILIAIKDKDYDLVHVRSDAVLAYSYRHLNKPANKRSHIFIKMLAKIEQASFDKKNTIRHTKQLYESLSSLRRPGWLYEDIVEVVPYEVLWDQVLKFLD